MIDAVVAEDDARQAFYHAMDKEDSNAVERCAQELGQRVAEFNTALRALKVVREL